MTDDETLRRRRGIEARATRAQVLSRLKAATDSSDLGIRLRALRILSTFHRRPEA